MGERWRRGGKGSTGRPGEERREELTEEGGEQPSGGADPLQR